MRMSSARNVHFERSRALGSLNARRLGAIGHGRGTSIVLGLGLICRYRFRGFLRREATRTSEVKRARLRILQLQVAHSHSGGAFSMNRT